MAQALPQAPPIKADLGAAKPTSIATIGKGLGRASPHEIGPQKSTSSFAHLLEHASKPALKPGESNGEKVGASDSGSKAARHRPLLHAAKLASAPEKEGPPQSKVAKEAPNGAKDAALVVSTIVPTPMTKSPSDGLEKGQTKKDEKSAPIDGKAVRVAAGQDAIASSVWASAKAVAEHGEKGAERPKVSVVDKRTDTKQHAKEKSRSDEVVVNQPISAQPKSETLHKPGDVVDKGNAPVVTFHDASDQGKSPFALTSQNVLPTARDAMTFQQWLVDKGYGQMVDQARIVLKDNNAGEIRMTLYPQSLGKVKVSLNLTDNSLAGHIFVENQTVKDVFQSNMNSLVQSFRDGGWNTMSLQVSVGNGGGQQQSSPQGQNWNGQSRDYDHQLSTASVGSSLGENTSSWRDQRVNLTV